MRWADDLLVVEKRKTDEMHLDSCDDLGDALRSYLRRIARASTVFHSQAAEQIIVSTGLKSIPIVEKCFPRKFTTNVMSLNFACHWALKHTRTLAHQTSFRVKQRHIPNTDVLWTLNIQRKQSAIETHHTEIDIWFCSVPFASCCLLRGSHVLVFLRLFFIWSVSISFVFLSAFRYLHRRNGRWNASNMDRRTHARIAQL